MKIWKTLFPRSTKSVEEICRRGEGVCFWSGGRRGEGLFWQVMERSGRTDLEVACGAPGADLFLRSYRGGLLAGS